MLKMRVIPCLDVKDGRVVKGVFNGNFRLVLYGIGVIAVATIVVHMLRNRYVKRPG